ncbi:hypothetical protein [Peribacillus deserti]|nr:hypothetical protein [Peribacillus deserti]
MLNEPSSKYMYKQGTKLIYDSFYQRQTVKDTNGFKKIIDSVAAKLPGN